MLFAVACMAVVAAGTAANAWMMEPILDEVFFNQNRRVLWLVPLAIVYFLSPVDLLPDWRPFGIGRFDDLIVLGLAVLLLTRLAPQHVIDEHSGKPRVSDRPEDKDPDKVVDGSSRLIDDE